MMLGKIISTGKHRTEKLSSVLTCSSKTLNATDASLVSETLSLSAVIFKVSSAEELTIKTDLFTIWRITEFIIAHCKGHYDDR